MSFAVSEYQAVGRRAVGRILAVVMALSLAFATLFATSPAAVAATAGISADITLNGEKYNGTDVVQEGQELKLRVAYDQNLVPGATVTFDLGQAVTVDSIPAGNDAIESIVQDGNKVTITFKNPIPVNQGIFELGLKVNSVEKSETTKISWTIDGEESSIDVIVKNQGDEFANVNDGTAKSVKLDALKPYVTVGENCAVTLDPAVQNHDITYTLNVDSKTARSGYSIKDVLPTGFEYAAGSFNSTLTTWDAQGLNKTQAAFAFAPTVTPSADPATEGESFRGSVDVPANSKLAISYKVKVSDAGLTLIQEQLKAACQAMNGGPGQFTVPKTNTATFGGDTTQTRSATFNFHGDIAGVDVGEAFGKRADWTHKYVEVAEDGTLTPAQLITFTLSADLSGWHGTGANFQLNRNVVIVDTLPTQGSWDTTATEFITSTGMTLTESTICPSESDFKDDKFVGHYCVNGQTLFVNIGKSNTTKVTIEAKALITTVAGLEKANGETSVVGGLGYKFRNEGEFVYSDSKSHTAGWNSFPIVLPETDDGYNDPKAFSKSGTPHATSVKPGEKLLVDYKFAVGAGKDVDMRTSTIVDYLNDELFELGDLDSLKLTGRYDNQNLTRAHFTVVQDAERNLRITLSDSGKAIVTSKGADKSFSMILTLTTKPFDGKETVSLKNKGALLGSNDEQLYWSETSSEATSYGDEAEVRKTIIDPVTGESVSNLDAVVDADGNLVRDTYTYRVEFLPHGSYNDVVISDVVDVLPGSVDFLGFVTKANAQTGANPTAGPVTLEGNIEAVYENGKVSLRQKQGTKLKAGQPIEAYFAVQITDATAPVINKIGTSSTTITPVATFDLSKTVTGVQAANSAVPGTVEVTADWEIASTPASKVLTVPTDGSPVALGENLPLGTVVTLTESALVDGNGVIWGTPVWAGTGVTAGSHGTATVVIGETDAAGVTLTNQANTSVGSVNIEKHLEGGAKDLVTLAGYEVTAKIDAGAGNSVPDRVVTVKVGELTKLENLPVGATVTFSEAKPVDTDELTWATPVISPSSLVITEDHFTNPATITVTNSVERTVGTFDIVKTITGEEEDNPAVPATVEVTATWADGTKVLTVPTDGTPVSFGEQLLIGTEVTLTEAPLSDGDSIAWAAPAWGGTGVTLNTNGDATVTIGRDADARVTLENHAATSVAGISLIKQISGGAAAQVDPSTEFTVRASWDIGSGEQQKDLKINAATPTLLGEDLPAGTVVTLTELDRPAITGVDWGAIVFSGDRITPGTEGSAQFVVSTQQGAVDLVTVSNEANWSPGTFNLAKQVTGVPMDHADVPADVTVRATWFDGTAEQSKDIKVPTDGTKVPFGESLSHETQVVLTEVELGQSASFTWAAPEWNGEGVTSAQGGAAELKIGAALDTEITLTNAAVATTGSLSITKSLTGAGAADVPEGTEFPVTASWTDLQGKPQERAITVTAGEASVIEGVNFGTEVTLREGDLPDTGDAKWLSAAWSTLSDSVKLTPNGVEAVLVVTGAAGDSVALTLANEYEAPDSGTNANTNTKDDGAGKGSGLPTTGGAGFGLMAVIGAALVGGGALLFMRRSRRRA